MMRKIVKFSDEGNYQGITLSGEPCELFDTLPPETPEEILLKLQAGGMAQDLYRRRSILDEVELQEYKQYEYACDYIQEYHDFVNKKYNKVVPAKEEEAGKTTEAGKSSADSEVQGGVNSAPSNAENAPPA